MVYDRIKPKKKQKCFTKMNGLVIAKIIHMVFVI